MENMHDRDAKRYSVKGLCRLFGFSAQAYHKRRRSCSRKADGCLQTAGILEFCRAERSLDPRIGCRKLWAIYNSEFDHVGRRVFESVLSDNGLCVRTARRRTRTTDSRHKLPVYPNLVYRTVPERPCQVWVADITYIRLNNPDGSTRFCYLSIVMDAYSRYILGHYVGTTLDTVYSLVALNIALETCHRLRLDTSRTIHHSDRGVQYASADYVGTLKANGIRISMTESDNPTDNAQAERVNSTIKNELLYGLSFSDINGVANALRDRIDYYNTRRPHMSLGGSTPAQALTRSGRIKKQWRSYRDEAINATELNDILTNNL